MASLILYPLGEILMLHGFGACLSDVARASSANLPCIRQRSLQIKVM